MFDKIIRGLFGGSVSGGELDWDELRKIMSYSADLNRFDDQGPFGSTQWEEGPDGRWTRTNAVDPLMQPGVDRLMDRSSYGTGQPYQMPQQFSQLLDAKMANQMQRQGIGQGGAPPDPSVYGTPSAEQPGRTPTGYQPSPMFLDKLMQQQNQGTGQVDQQSQWDLLNRIGQQVP